MTNKRREFSKDQPFVTHPSAPLGTPLTQIVLPCGGVVGEPIAPSELPTADSPEAEDPLAAAQFAAIARPTLPATPSGSGPTQTCEQAVGFCEVAIAFLIFGTILGWLTTVPLWLPQFAPKPYSVTPWCVHFYSNSQPFDLISSALFSPKKSPRTIETA
ncbi:MAG: hypothetical protein KME12_19965 [Trichocoleus desertorum ATA4-8-CV12]|jgi:hypothetical protein|nr:hypothetical protein [Trichocoleus desertorum ATA4-8-CV12]